MAEKSEQDDIVSDELVGPQRKVYVAKCRDESLRELLVEVSNAVHTVALSVRSLGASCLSCSGNAR